MEGMRIEMTRCDFCVELTSEQWQALTAIDKNGEEVHETATGYETPGIKRLTEAGCFGFEWNGHFGRNFFFKAKAEDVKAAKAAKAAVRKFIGGLAR